MCDAKINGFVLLWRVYKVRLFVCVFVFSSPSSEQLCACTNRNMGSLRLCCCIKTRSIVWKWTQSVMLMSPSFEVFPYFWLSLPTFHTTSFIGTMHTMKKHLPFVFEDICRLTLKTSKGPTTA